MKDSWISLCALYDPTHFTITSRLLNLPFCSDGGKSSYRARWTWFIGLGIRQRWERAPSIIRHIRKNHIPLRDKWGSQCSRRFSPLVAQVNSSWLSFLLQFLLLLFLRKRWWLWCMAGHYDAHWKNHQMLCFLLSNSIKTSLLEPSRPESF